MTERTPPLATYRLQLVPGVCTFAEAAGLVGYLADLGITHLYLSPILRAVPGSTHGYDVVEPGEVAPALGGEDGLRALADAAHARGLGLVADLVPNHVGVHPDNPLWDGLLAHGPAGDEAAAFDVNWEPALPGAAQKVILPVLGEQYGEALFRGDLRVVRDPGRGWRLRYHDHDFPLSAESCDALERSGGADALMGEPGVPDSWQRLHALLERQHYRLVSWRIGHRVINYRRFFAVDALAAVRVEDETVFERTHHTILRLLDEGVLDGLRIDHPDGLRDPAGYLRRLRERAGDAWIVVEKIVQAPAQQPETLPDWPVHGTTGYEFCNDVLGLFVDPDAEAALTALDRELGGADEPFGALAVAAKRELLTTDLSSEHQRLTSLLWRLAQQHPAVRDVDDRDLAEAVAAVIAELDVYRPYVDPVTGRATAEDAARIDAAAERAHAGGGTPVPGEVFDLVAASAAGRLGTSADHLDFAARFAQLSSTAMAKGVEDTAFYRWRRLLALNQVGGEPGRFGLDVEEFHRRNAERARRHPAGMLTTSTHDTKHGEDVRLRMAAISERPTEWGALVRRWAPGAPDGQAAQLVLQTLAGAWPLDGSAPDALPGAALRERFHAYLVKALREARQQTDWADPDEGYERAVAGWLDGLLADATFIAEFAAEASALAEIGMVASLAQTLLRCTSPGVPDTYQGCELWEDSLVDPDNRRAVDFDMRARMLGELGDKADAAQLWESRRDGRVKLWVLHQALQIRRRFPDCFGPESGYEPLRAEGAMAAHVVAFARTSPAGRRPPDGRPSPAGPRVIAVAPRLPGAVLRAGWPDTTVTLPEGDWLDLLTGRQPAATARNAGSPRLAELLGVLPVALLTRQ